MSRPRICPICKTPMAYIQESEAIGGEKRLTRYYKCPACGAKIVDEVLRVVRVNGEVRIIIEQNGSGKLIRPQRAPRRRLPPRKAR